MSGKAELVSNLQITGKKQIPLKGKVKSVAITCQDVSANKLLIGWNESPSTKDYLSPGESYAVTPDQGNFLDGNEIRLDFATDNPITTQTNQALVKITYETDKEIC